MSESEPPHVSLQWDPSKLHFDFPVPDKEQRLKELIIYVAHECLDDPTFSKVKLLKIMFFSDFGAYGKHGTPITGMPYRKLPFGPAPADFKRIQEEMIRDRLIRIVDRKVHDQSRQRVLPLRDPESNLFSGSQISIVDNWIKFFWNMTAKEVSEYSHGKPPWKLATMSQLIPYEAIFISDELVTYEDVDRVKELAKQYDWKL